MGKRIIICRGSNYKKSREEYYKNKKIPYSNRQLDKAIWNSTKILAKGGRPDGDHPLLGKKNKGVRSFHPTGNKSDNFVVNYYENDTEPNSRVKKIVTLRDIGNHNTQESYNYNIHKNKRLNEMIRRNRIDFLIEQTYQNKKQRIREKYYYKPIKVDHRIETLDEFVERRNAEKYNDGYDQALFDILEMINNNFSCGEIYESIGDYIS